MTYAVDILAGIMGICSIIYAIKLYTEFSRKRHTWELLTAEVIKMEIRLDIDKDNMFWPWYKYSFNDINYSAVGKIGSAPPSYKVGQVIEIIVNPKSPSESEIVDMRFKVVPILLVLLGITLISVPFLIWKL